uniref:Uncharacterized protein n=1 Tax=Chenopodium quinoa TaxID=63459 RepID=A0A803L802_CHEQI
MSDQDQQLQHRWNFRRTENDFDSSDDDHSRPSSSSEPTKHKLVTSQFSEENAQQTMHNPTSIPSGENENQLNFEEPNRKLNQPGKTCERKARSKKTKRTTLNYEPSDATLINLSGYMESLVEEIKTARVDLLAWMSNELTSSSKDDVISSKPSGPKKGQKQNTKRSKTPRNNPNKGRKRPGTSTQNKTNEEVVVLSKEGENVIVDAKSVEKTEAKSVEKTEAKPVEKTEAKPAQKQKGKTSRSSTKKRKTDGTEAVEQTITAAADICVALPSVLPQNQVTNCERIPLEDGNDRDAVNRNVLNPGVNLSSQCLNFDPRAQQKDGIFAQGGLRNVSDFGQNSCPTMGNGNGNGFPFPLAPQGSNCGIGLPNVPNQFGQQYLSQSNRMSGMFGEPSLFSNGNHAYMEKYGVLNQPLRFNFQQSGVMALQCPDIRRGAFNQDNVTNQ